MNPVTPAIMNMQEICRICMEIAWKPTNIYKTMVQDDLVANLMIECADIEVYTGDGCPDIVCATCLASLEHAYSFQKQIKRSDNILKEMVDRIPAVDEEPSIQKIEIERLDYKLECESDGIKEIMIEDTKVEIEEYEQGDNDDVEDVRMPRWMLPNQTPNQTHLFYCCLCTEVFQTRILRQQHAAEVHFIDPNKPLFFHGRLTHSCTVCRQVAFGTAAALDNHLKAKAVLLCSVCGKPYTKATISKHMQVHEREKDRAQLSHTKKAFIPCQICGKLISSHKIDGHLARHIDGRRYECDHCGKQFTRKSYLQMHVKRHFPELMTQRAKNYSCSQCEKAFENLQKLNSHFVVHTNERPYHCDYCEMKFKNLTDLRRHRWLKHIESPYTCKRCLKPFDRPMTLNKHEAVCRG